jgi:hypothetical protein
MSFPVVLVFNFFKDLEIIDVPQFADFTSFDGLFYCAARLVSVRAIGKTTV